MRAPLSPRPTAGRPAPARRLPRSLCLETLEDRTTPVAGAPDPGFGTGGLVHTALSGVSYGGPAVAEQPDHKLVVASNFVRPGTASTYDTRLTRFNPDGTVDAAFGAGSPDADSPGSVVNRYCDQPTAVRVLPNGKILVAGSANLGGPNYLFFLARYQSSGALDPTFGTPAGGLPAGVVTYDAGGSGASMGLLSDGSIVLGGYGGGGMALTHYTANGGLDTGFGSGGVARLTNGSDLWDLAVQPDDKIVAVGRASATDLVLARFTAAGQLDPAFHGLGWVTQAFGTTIAPYSVSVQSYRLAGATDPTVRIVASCDTAGTQVLGYTAGGDLDPAFGTAGIFTSGGGTGQLNRIKDTVVQSDGKILLIGGTPGGFTHPVDFGIARLTPAGQPDPSFGGTGAVETDVGGTDIGWRGVLQADGKLVVAGITFTASYSLALARYETADPQPPVANAGGPYTVVTGQSVQLTGLGSTDNSATPLTYQWDLDGDGFYETAGATPTFSAAGLEAGVRTVALRVTDDEGLSATATATVRVTQPPVANAGGPYMVVTGGSALLAGSGTDNSATPLGYAWDLDNNGSFETAGPSPNFSAVGLTPGTYAIVLRVTDDEGLSATATTAIQVVAAAVLPDPTYPGQSSLFVGGTMGRDVIVVAPSANPGGVDVQINGVLVGTFAPTGRVVVYAQAGDDDVQVAGGVRLDAWLYGGDGADRLKGGGGHNVLLGGDGDDLLVGGNDRDVLVGGAGADRLVGNAEDDIMVAGSTLFDADESALATILAAWVDPAKTYQQRVTAVGTTGVGASQAIRLDATTVSDDGAADVLTGTAGSDWFFANVAGGGVRDKITDLSAAEFVVDLDFITGP